MKTNDTMTPKEYLRANISVSINTLEDAFEYWKESTRKILLQSTTDVYVISSYWETSESYSCWRFSPPEENYNEIMQRF